MIARRMDRLLRLVRQRQQSVEEITGSDASAHGGHSGTLTGPRIHVTPQGMLVDIEPTFSCGAQELLFDTRGYGSPDTVGETPRIDISPDGKRVLMFKEGSGSEETVVPGDTILVVNCLEELIERVPVQ